MSYNNSQPLLWMTVGRSVLEKFDKMTWHSEWIACLEKFSEKSCRALSSWNRTWEGVGSEEENALKRRGFQDGVDFHLGAIEQLTKRMREKERERHAEKHQSQSIYKNIENVRYVYMKMHKHVICNSKNIMGSAQSNPTDTQSFQQSKHTSKMHETLL